MKSFYGVLGFRKAQRDAGLLIICLVTYTGPKINWISVRFSLQDLYGKMSKFIYDGWQADDFSHK